jgi:hypothetical protein
MIATQDGATPAAGELGTQVRGSEEIAQCLLEGSRQLVAAPASLFDADRPAVGEGCAEQRLRASSASNTYRVWSSWTSPLVRRARA